MFYRNRILLPGLALPLLFACATEPQIKPVAQTEKKIPEILTVQVDGDMVYRDRTMLQRDVIIYEDGRGGERAAVRVFDPLHSDYFRDSIVVEREEPTQSGSVTE